MAEIDPKEELRREIDPKEELRRNINTLARHIHMELTNAGIKGLLPLDQISVRDTDEGVLVQFFEASKPKRAKTKELD